VSGGVHRSDNGDVLLRLTDGNISKAEQRILIHEVTHQCLEPLLKDAPPWLIEGVAMYVESIPFYDGAFQREWVYFRRAPLFHNGVSDQFETVPLVNLLRSDRFDWNDHFRVNPHGVNRHYQTAYLLTYYLVHFKAEPCGDPFGQFLTALDEALKNASSREKVLRSGRYRPSPAECVELEADFIAAFREAELTLHPMTGFTQLNPR
jgi:hypothetical protein